jgi:signal peptidase I
MSDSVKDEHSFKDGQDNPQKPLLKEIKMKKARLKIMAALFSVIVMIVIPFIRSKHLAFNAFYNTTLEDWVLIWDFEQGSVPFFLRVPVFYLFVGLGVLYIIVLFSGMSKAENKPEEFDESSFKKMYGRFDILVFVLHLMAIYMVVNAFFFSVATIDGNSMNPTLQNKDNVVMMHMDETYERFDLVVVKPDPLEDEFYIKRLIGLPGDEIRIDLGEVYVNNRLLEEPYLDEGVDTLCTSRQGETIDVCTFTMEEDEYFVMGDNRNNSTDSRSLGNFEKDAIYGTVNYRLSPLSAIGKVE